MRQPVGCLLIGETRRMYALDEKLSERGVETVSVLRSRNLLSGMQEGLRAARRPGGVCIAAEGEMWAAALALAVQLTVDRVALIAPTDCRKNTKSDWERQIERMKGYACRNLFFCVSEVLLLEEEGDIRSERRMDLLCRRLCNSRVHRLSLSDQRWTKCEQSPLEAAARFLEGGELMFSLAKNL